MRSLYAAYAVLHRVLPVEVGDGEDLIFLLKQRKERRRYDMYTREGSQSVEFIITSEPLHRRLQAIVGGTHLTCLHILPSDKVVFVIEDEVA